MGGVLALVALVVVWSSEVEAQDQNVHLELSDGTQVANHGILYRGELRNNPLLCVTPDNITCCSTAETGGAPLGNWYFPNGTEVPPDSTGWVFYTTRGPGLVQLHRHTGGVSGIHHCVIPDLSVFNQTLYVGLYINIQSSGHLVLQNALQFQLLTEPNIDPPVFTLTYSTTGGPPTVVSWTRDSRTVLYDSSFVFSQTVTNFVAATYTNTLTITGRHPGQYTLTAHNRNTDSYTVSIPVTSTFQVTAADSPTNLTLTAFQSSDNSTILVSWSAPVSDANVAQYRIYYQSEDHLGMVDVDRDTTEFILTGLHHGMTYNISLVALSVHLPSPVVGPIQITLEAPGSSSDVTFILEATTTLDIPFGSTASATASQATHSLTPIDIGSPTTSAHSPTTEPTLSSTSSPTPTPNTTLYNTQDATTDTDDPSTPDTTPDPTLSHSAVLIASPHTTTDTDVTVTPQRTLNPTPTLCAAPDSTGFFTGAVIAGTVAGAVAAAAALVGLLVLVVFICFCRNKSMFQVAPEQLAADSQEQHSVSQVAPEQLPADSQEQRSVSQVAPEQLPADSQEQHRTVSETVLP